MELTKLSFTVAVIIFRLQLLVWPSARAIPDPHQEVRVKGQWLVQSEGCIWIDLSKGGTIDLRSLANTDGTARFPDVKAPDSFFYSYNPCYGFNEGTCSNAYVCQATATKDQYYLAGTVASGVQMNRDGYGRTVLHYQATTDIQRNSYVTLICDNKAHQPSIKALGDLSYAKYYMELTTICACPDGCSGGSGITITVSIDLSAGWILTIAFLALAVLYLVAGVVYNWGRYRRRGAELLPHLSLWASLPGLIKDGCLFTKSKVCGGAGRAGYEKK